MIRVLLPNLRNEQLKRHQANASSFFTSHPVTSPHQCLDNIILIFLVDPKNGGSISLSDIPHSAFIAVIVTVIVISESQRLLNV